MDSFVFYESFAQAASTLGDKARLKLYDAVVKLGLSCAEDEPTLNQVCADIESSLAQNRNVFAQFLLIKPQILANFKRKINGRKGAEFGVFGGAPIGNKNASKNNPKTTPNVNANVNVNGDNIPPISPQKKNIKTLVKDDWQPSEATKAKLEAQGLDVGKVVERFINSCQAKGLKYANFDRAILAWDWSRDKTVKKRDVMAEMEAILGSDEDLHKTREIVW